MNYLSELNPSQRAAVEYNDGPQLVIAGAGSGKTRVLTYKIAYLLEHGIPAGHILALTFTNKAAREMKGRIAQLVGDEVARYLWMGTFHSICARILRQEADKIGYTRDYSIYDTTDSKSLLKHIVKDMQLDEKTYKVGTLLGRISMAKNHLLSPTQYAANREFTMQDRFERLYEMTRIYTEYNRRLRAANAMDFDDLLFMTNVLFKQDEEVLHKYQDIFQYVLVDEYQDTNYSQYLIVKRLAEPQNHVCVVGDDAQSIYSFRGANIENILTFQKGYANAQMFKLERNYRSTQTIVNAANSLIRHNKGQIFKEVYSEKEQGDRLRLSTYMTDRDEAQAVAQQIKMLMKAGAKGDLTYDDIAVMYRTNAQSRMFEEELRRLSIPYRIYGGVSFYQRKEVKDALAYFRLAVNPLDNEALLRIVNYPTRGIGETTMARVGDTARNLKISLFDVISDPNGTQLEVSATTKKKLVEFAQMIQRFSQYAETRDAYTFADDVLRESGVMRDAQSDTSQEGIARKENLEEIISSVKEYANRRSKQGEQFTSINDFLAEVSLLTDKDTQQDDEQPRVTLLTIHAAKGLEFRVVFITGLEEGLIPSNFCNTNKEIEEERRLLYVAITRAMEQCYLTHAQQRMHNGQLKAPELSHFVKDIDPRFIMQVEASRMGDGILSVPKGYKPSTNGVSRTAASPAPAPQNLRRTTGALEKTAKKSIRSEWKKDDRINHRTFGDGTVLEVYRENENDKIDIQFDNVGKKTLLLTYAKLTRI